MAREIGRALGKIAQLDAEAPYFVGADQLRALGIDPDPYFACLSTHGGGALCGHMLHCEKDAELIQRLQSMRDPHTGMQ